MAVVIPLVAPRLVPTLFADESAIRLRGHWLELIPGNAIGTADNERHGGPSPADFAGKNSPSLGGLKYTEGLAAEVKAHVCSTH
jgi:hypothetical protein